jgi:hypothetical protein
MRVSYCTSDCSSIIIDVLVYALDYQRSTVYCAVQCLSSRLLAMQHYICMHYALNCTALQVYSMLSKLHILVLLLHMVVFA